MALTVAGRTDRGVHASGQVCSYDGPLPGRLKSVNAVLPADVSVLDASIMPAGWSARFDAKARSYAYRIDRSPHGPSPFTLRWATWWPHGASFEALQACAATMVGEHDFTAFTPTDTYHVRFSRIVFAAAWEDRGGEWVFTIEADAFMRNMIRALVGTMLEVASERRTLESFVALLAGAPREAAGPTASPKGLCLTGVRY